MVDDLPGSIVSDLSGRRYARLEEVFAGRTSGRPEFGVLSLDEEGTERVVVPLAGLRQEGGVVVLPLDVDRVVAAPRMQADVDEIPAEAGRHVLAHFGLDEAATEPMPSAAPAAPAAPAGPAEDTTEILVSEEQLAVETRSVPTERVHVRKEVVTEDVTITVTLRREELVIEREPIDAAAGAAHGDDRLAVDGEEFEVVLHAEEPVVTKRVMPVERVRLRRNEIVEERRITDTVRKEHVDVDEIPTNEEHTTP